MISWTMMGAMGFGALPEWEWAGYAMMIGVMGFGTACVIGVAVFYLIRFFVRIIRYTHNKTEPLWYVGRSGWPRAALLRARRSRVPPRGVPGTPPGRKVGDPGAGRMRA